MPDMSALAAAISSLKSAKDIAEAMISLRDGAAFQAKLLEFQSKLIDANNSTFAAQDERTSLLERVSDLEKQVANMKAWNTEKERYELKALDSGAFAYVLKPDAQPPEAPHWLCTTCYANSQKRIMQKAQHGRECLWLCQSCKTNFQVPYTVYPGSAA